MMIKVNSGALDIDYLPQGQKALLEKLASRELQVDVDKANTAYGHGMARTHDFGFQPGENMCTQVPMDVKAHLRTLRTSTDRTS